MNFNSKNQYKLIAIVALGLVAIIAISAVIISVLTPKKTPVSAEYITVTIDNSISASFTLNNSDYSVTDAKTYKKSDNYLVKDISNTYLSFTQTMDSFLKELVAAGKITTEKDEVLLFSVESRNEKDFDTLVGYFHNALKNAGIEARVYTLYIKVKLDSTIEFAQEHDVSYAKAHLCTKLEKENSKLKAEELITLSITEIVERANKVAADDLLSRVESDTNEEQRKEEIPEEKDESSSSETSSDASSDATSSDDTSSGDTSSGDMSSGDTSSGDMSSGDTSSGDTSSGDTSSGNTSSGNTSSGNTSSGDTSSGDTSSGDTSSGDTSSGDTSSGNTSSGDTSSNSSPSFVVSSDDKGWTTIR